MFISQLSILYTASKLEGILLFVFIGCFSLNLHAQTTYWVSNRIADEPIVDFLNLQIAIDNSDAGDTIMIYSSGTSYGNLSVNKTLYFYGNGYNLDIINQPSLDIQTAFFNPSIDDLNIVAGNNGSEFNGIKMKGADLNNVDNVVFANCSIDRIRFTNCSDILISSCLFGNSYYNYGGADAYNLVLISSINMIVSNNLFSIYSSDQVLRSLYVGPGCDNVQIQNNIFPDIVVVNNSIFLNNILMNSAGNNSSAFYSTVVSNNIFDGTPNNTIYSGNLYNVPSSTIFVGYPNQFNYSFDSRYQLLPASPAREYGSNGEDCGVFDGDYPYRLSGITNRPIISELEVPTSTYNDAMEVQIRVKIIDQ